MPPYVPEDKPQKFGWDLGGKAGAVHEAEIQRWGPPPPNFDVFRAVETKGSDGYYMRYKNLNNSSDKGTRHHPMSINTLVAPIYPEEPTFAREKVVGFFRPPIDYRASHQVKWRYFDTSQKALCTALNFHRVTVPAGKNDERRPLNPADMDTALGRVKNQADPENYILWDPADRNTLVLKGEPEVAMTARFFGYDLILIVPLIVVGGFGYKQFYNVTNRPPNYPRYSTGRQGQGKALVMGCLPKQLTTKGLDVMWFFLEPTPKNSPIWYNNMYNAFDLKAIATKLGWPIDNLPPHFFLWALVSLQRRIVLGYDIPADHMACWIWQFGQHVLHCKNNSQGPSKWSYDVNKLSTYKQQHPNSDITFSTLTAWTINPNFRLNNISIQTYTKPWEDAIQTYIKYQLDKTDENWKNYQDNMRFVSAFPH